MISEKNVTRGAIFALALGFVGLGYNQTRARADGIPGMLPLTYAGQLEEGGAAVNGSRNLRLTIWDDASSTESSRTRCITTAPGATVTSGRFQVVLDNACTAVVRATPDLWLEIEVNGSSLGRTKLSAVPFAIEANRASGLTPAAANALIPTGTIVAFGGNTDRVPAGWLPCDGRSVTRAMFPELFDALGTAHGGNGTNFNLPDYRGRFLRGVDGMAARDPGAAGRTAANMGGNNGNAVGSVEGFATGLPVSAFTTTTAGDHRHMLPTATSDVAGSNPTLGLSNQSVPEAQIAANITRRETTNNGVHTHGLTGGDPETRPVNAAVNFIIKL